MTLNKTICKRCRKENRQTTWWVKQEWDVIDEKWWVETNSVVCSETAKYEYIDIIPDTCPYKLEHLVLKGRAQLKVTGGDNIT